jgi:hypothetical protein
MISIIIIIIIRSLQSSLFKRAYNIGRKEIDRRPTDTIDLHPTFDHLSCRCEAAVSNQQ